MNTRCATSSTTSVEKTISEARLQNCRKHSAAMEMRTGTKTTRKPALRAAHRRTAAVRSRCFALCPAAAALTTTNTAASAGAMYTRS